LTDRASEQDSTIEKQTLLERIFQIKGRGSSLRQEFIGGLTTFATMGYVAIVLPTFYTHVGMPKDIAISSVIMVVFGGTLLMGLLANMPIALAPGLGLAAYFSYTVCDSMSVPSATAFAATVVAGFILFLIVLTDAWRKIVESMPLVLRLSITAGIGLFITFIGLKNGGVIVAHESTYVALGNMLHPRVLVTIGGVILGGILMARKIPGALFLTLLVMTVVCMFVGISRVPESLGACFSPVVKLPRFVVGKVDFQGLMNLDMFQVIFTITLIGFFDGVGVLLGLSRKANLAPPDGVAPGFRRAMLTSSLTTMGGACIGTSVPTVYIESAAGIASGGRTGLSSVVTALMFAVMLFFQPLIDLVPIEVGSVALILVGSMMLGELRNVNFDDITDSLPAFFTVLMMVLTFSIAEGIAFGFILYAFLKLFSGRGREVKPILYLVALVFILHLALR